MKIIKYIGRFSGAEAKGQEFKRNVPTVVMDDKLALALVEQPDFVKSDQAELEAYFAEQEKAAQPAKAEPATTLVKDLVIAPTGSEAAKEGK